VEGLLTEVAGEIARAVLDGALAVPRDVLGGPPNLHDLDVVLRDGSTIPVEVTIATNPAVRQLWAAVGKQRWDIPGLRSSWSLDISPDTRINELRRALSPLLGELERRGVDRFNASEPHDEPMSDLGRLGVRFAKAVRGLPEPMVLVGSVGPADFVDGSDICDAVEHEAAKTDNRNKLLAAGGGDLFVWVDPHAANAYAALSGTVSIPRRPPRLPDGINSVWAARYIMRPSGRPGAAAVLRGDPTAGWSDVTNRAFTG
jgi:hypothetical protein